MGHGSASFFVIDQCKNLHLPRKGMIVDIRYYQTNTMYDIIINIGHMKEK